ncbi:MAG: ribosomal protein S18-alanine N-acetyltransferase [Acidimicrobiales bacterium]|jgi:[ribosomal protein S18]-alanine N-acetyltransferase
MVAEPKPLTDTIEIVLMRRKHLHEVMRIEAQEYVRPWTSTLFVSELAQKTRRYTVATMGGVVVGYTGLMLIEDEGHVNTLTVDGTFHRQGIGTMLLLDLARAAAEAGSHHITLEVREHNEGAKALYMQFGFAPIGVRRNYYEETGENAIVMCARDVHTPEYIQRLDRIESKLMFKQ